MGKIMVDNFIEKVGLALERDGLGGREEDCMSGETQETY